MAAHLHRATRCYTMARPDAVYLHCRCGEVLPYGVYWVAPPPAPEGWDPIHWRLHGYRKALATAQRWLKHVKRLHRLWDRALVRRAKAAGRTPDEQIEHEINEAAP